MLIQKNRYFRRSKLSEAKVLQILRYFAMDFTATDCAELSGVSVRSITSIYLRLRRHMAEQCEKVFPFGGELWAAAGSVDTDLSVLSLPKVYRTDVTQRRMPARRVVEPLNVVKDIRASLLPELSLHFSSKRRGTRRTHRSSPRQLLHPNMRLVP